MHGFPLALTSTGTDHREAFSAETDLSLSATYGINVAGNFPVHGMGHWCGYVISTADTIRTLHLSRRDYGYVVGRSAIPSYYRTVHRDDYK